MVKPELQRLIVDFYVKFGYNISNLKYITSQNLNYIFNKYEAKIDYIKQNYMKQYERLYSSTQDNFDKLNKLQQRMEADIITAREQAIDDVLAYEVQTLISSFKWDLYKRCLYGMYCLRLGIFKNFFEQIPFWTRGYKDLKIEDVLSCMAEILAYDNGNVTAFLYDWGLIKKRHLTQPSLDFKSIEERFICKLKLNVPMGL